MTPVMFNSVLRGALSRYERAHHDYHPDLGLFMTEWRTDDQRRSVYDKAMGAASARMLEEMRAEWDAVIGLALLEMAALNATALLNDASEKKVYPRAQTEVNEVCTTLAIGRHRPLEGCTSERYLLDMLGRANSTEGEWEGSRAELA